MRIRTTIIGLVTVAPMAAWGQFFTGGSDNIKPWDHFKLPKTMVKLDLGNASVDAVISLFEKVSGISIVKDPALVGKLPVTSAKAVNLATAFQILSTTLSLKGYDLQREDNLLVIRAKPKDGGGFGGPGGGFGQGNPFGSGDSGFGGGDNTQHLETYPIKFANASQVAKVINDVFAPATGANANTGGFQFGGGGFRGGRGGGFNQFNVGAQPGGNQGDQGGGFGRRQTLPVRASADDYSNTVIINGTRSQQDDVYKIIKKIDTKTDQPQTSKVYRLVYASAPDIASVVQNVLVSNAPLGRGGATSQNTDPGQRFQQALRLGSSQASFGQVAVDSRTNSLVVTATEENQTIIETVVRELDTPVDVQTTTFVFPLQNAKATDVANLLLGAFGQRQGVSNTNRTTTTSSTHTTGITSSGSTSSSSATGNRAPGSLGSVQNQDLYANNLPIVNGQATPMTDAVRSATSSDGHTIPIELADPTAASGELLTEVGVTQGFGGGFFGGQRPGGGGGGGFGASTQQSSGSATTARDANGQLVNVKDLTGQVTAIPDPNTNSIVIVTTPDGAQIIKNVLAQLDHIPQQVVIQTMIIEASLDKADKLGVEWETVANKVLNTSGATGVGVTDFGNQTTPPAQGLRYTLTSANLDGFINALKTDTAFRVLSTPRIFTSNNITAQINISQAIPYVTSSIQDATTGAFTYNYEFLDVGIVLTVTPQITSNGYVTMDVTQTANTLQGYTSFNAPIVNQRTATTTVSVKDTETVVLGGIIQSQVTSTVNKVPILGDIPILGHLFRSTSKDDTRTELLVFMTPRIVNNDADAKHATDQAINQLGPATRDLIKKSIKDGVIDPGVQPGMTPKIVPPTGKQPGGTP